MMYNDFSARRAQPMFHPSGELTMNATQAKPASSAVANLESTTTHATIRAARPAGLKTGANFTGQYLHDRFIGNNKEELTKMELVRKMTDAVEVDDFKKIINDFVNISKDNLADIVKGEKEAGEYDENKPSAQVIAAQATYKTAQNHQTVLRLAYGAIRFASEQLEACGYTEKTGYQDMRVMAKKALDKAGIKWDGTKAESLEVRQARAAQAAENRALLKVQEDNPRNPDEDRKAYFARIDKLVEQQMHADQAEANAKRINDLVARFREMAGNELDEVLDALMRADQPAPGNEERPAVVH